MLFFCMIESWGQRRGFPFEIFVSFVQSMFLNRSEAERQTVPSIGHFGPILFPRCTRTNRQINRPAVGSHARTAPIGHRTGGLKGSMESLALPVTPCGRLTA